MNQDHGGIEACLEAGFPPSPALLEGHDPGAFLEEMTASGKLVGRVLAFRFEGGNGSELIGPDLQGVPVGLHPVKTTAAKPAGQPDCDAPAAAGAGGASTTTDAPQASGSPDGENEQ